MIEKLSTPKGGYLKQSTQLIKLGARLSKAKRERAQCTTAKECDSHSVVSESLQSLRL